MRLSLAKILVVVFVLAVGRASRADSICVGVTKPALIVHTGEHKLWLCENGDGAAYSVRLGSAGVGKTKAGDDKTPLGHYRLGEPRSSAEFGIFIPIAYPNAKERAHGFTGGSVGIHGPHRAVAWLGRLNSMFDTTAGCVGIASDSEMSAIAKWVRARKVNTVVIE